MRFKPLGKTHSIKLLVIEVRIITLVALIGGCLVGALVYTWFRPAHLAVVVGACSGLGFGLAKISQVPFSKEIFFSPLKGRVSFNP